MSGQHHKPGAPVVGFNHNLNYKGKVFHVQTEDSGAHHGHIITHVFMGGNILSSVKSSYAEILPTIDAGEIFAAVRKLMEDQHKLMMKGLLAGQHDAEILRRSGGTVYEPGVLAGGEKAPGLLVGGDRLDPKAPERTPRPAAAPPLVAKAAVTPAPIPKPLAVVAIAPPPRQPSAAPLPARPAAPPPMAARPLPAPPPPPPLARPAIATRPPPAPIVPPRPEPGRLGATPFGDGLVSERSLDEVILSYLAADLDANKR